MYILQIKHKLEQQKYSSDSDATMFEGNAHIYYVIAFNLQNKSTLLSFESLDE